MRSVQAIMSDGHLKTSIMRRVLIAFGATLLGLIVGAPVYGPPLLTQAGTYLVTHETPVKADAIVVLSGEVPARAMAAADLFRQGTGMTVFVSPGNISSIWKRAVHELGVDLPDDSEMNRRVLMRLGVPAAAIQKIDEADGTLGEARALFSIAQRSGFTRILVVTSKYHTRRAGKIFRWVFGDTMSVQVIGSSYDDFDPARWWDNRLDTYHVIMEYQKMMLFMLKRMKPS